CMHCYNTRHGEKIRFSEHYVNLLIVKGHHSLEVKKHEFLKVLVTGVAGIGKTVLVQKILSDFGSNQAHQTFDFVIQLTFRDLNLIDRPISLRELLLRKNGHLAREIDAILSRDDKLLIVLDGFDEFRHYKECEVEEFVTEPDQEAEVVQVISSLMQGELLPEASVLITSRPTAISHIPINCIDSFVIITGFSLAEIRDFFIRYFVEPALAERMFRCVETNSLMLTLCYIPAFCYIMCSILSSSDGFSSQTPRTMTDVYSQYLVALLRSHTQSRLEPLKTGAEIETQEKFSVVSTFLDKTSVQEQGCTEDVYSFTHFTVQEFFAALYYALGDQISLDILESKAGSSHELSTGYLDLFQRFLSGLLAERNQSLLSRHLQLGRNSRAEGYLSGLLKNIWSRCEKGVHILNQLHCFFEQQDSSLAQQVHPKVLRINVSNDALSPMDFTVMKYFLNLMDSNITELDLTGTNISSEFLRDLLPSLRKCHNLCSVFHNIFNILNYMYMFMVLLTFTQTSLGWTNIGDEELLILLEALKTNQTLREIW
uniref:NACHT, LRR and PYD domains-containing protein 3-like n=1 Tax=Scleropages formosus TaxID=113540 RepID=A0A8C9U0F5_SCLFO